MANTLTILSATEVYLGTVRLTYSRPPLRADDGGEHDSLNPAMYSISGPSEILVRRVDPVRGAPASVDVVLSQQLSVGTWTMTVGAVEAYDGTPLTAPTSVVFTVTNLALVEGVNRGAATDTAADRLRRHLNPALKGKDWNAAIEAFATGDQKNIDNARRGFDQLFLSSASGTYLTERAGDEGVQRPADLGMADSLFRQFAIRSKSKLTEEAILEILEVFYGTEAVMGYVESTVAEPFLLEDGDDLTVLIDGISTVTTKFYADEFQDIGAARAVEVVAVLNRSFRTNEVAAYALPYLDPETGDTFVRIFSGSRGLSSSVQVRGGKSMVSFLYPTVLATHTINPFWDIVLDPATDRLRFSPTSAFDMSLVQVGDVASIYGTFGTAFNPANQGSYEIVNVHRSYTGGVTLVQYFEVVNRNGVDQIGLAQADVFDLVVFRPKRGTVHSTPERAVIVSSVGDQVYITLPATSAAVNREPLRAAYLVSPPSVLVSNSTLIRRKSGVVTVDTADPHGMAAGDWFLMDGVYPDYTKPPVTAGGAGQTERSLGSIWTSPGTAAITGKVRSIACLLGDGRVLVSGGYNPASSAPGALVSTNGTQTFAVTAFTEVVDGEFRATATSTVRPAGPTVSGAAVSVGNPSSGSFLDGKALVTGGSNTGAAATPAATIFDHLTNTWAATTVMGTARWGHKQSTLTAGSNAGRVFVTGGQSVNLGAALATTEMYNPATATWTAKASMSQARADHAQVVLADGRILVVGGRSLNGYDLVYDLGPMLSSCEIYDPDTNTWTSTGRMSFSRTLHRAVLLQDGRVLVVGGYGCRPGQPDDIFVVRDAEIWDPATGAWRPAGRTRHERDVPIVHVLSTGKVVVSGGIDSTTTEIFDPVTMRWRRGLGTTLLRGEAVSVLMENDLIFTAGGYDPTNPFFAGDTQQRLYIPASDEVASGSLNGIFRVTEVVDTTTFKYETPGEGSYTRNSSPAATVTPAAAPEK